MEIFSYAKELYKEGKNEQAIVELEKILFVKPDHKESKNLIIMILTGLGMDTGMGGNHQKAIEYFKRALKLSPDDMSILELISISRSIIAIDDERKPLSAEILEAEKLKEMMATFEEYQRRQDKLMSEYAQTQAKIQIILERSEEEKQKLYRLLEEKKGFFNKNFLIISSLIILTTGGLVFVGRRLKKTRQVSSESPAQLKEELKTPEKTEKKEDLSGYEKKLKKLEIIESELAGKNPYENQVALNMLEQFFKDNDYRIKLRVIKIMHEIDTGTSVGILEKVIKQEKAEYKIAACKLLGELESFNSIELLLKLMDTDDEEIKEIIISSATRVVNNKVADDKLRTKIKSKLDEIYAQDGLVG